MTIKQIAEILAYRYKEEMRGKGTATVGWDEESAWMAVFFENMLRDKTLLAMMLGLEDR